jgi:hypothetical protein
MKDLNYLRNLTIYQIFKKALGEAKAQEFFEMFNKAIEEEKNGDELKKRIYSILCKFSVTDIEIFELTNILLKQVSPRH